MSILKKKFNIKKTVLIKCKIILQSTGCRVKYVIINKLNVYIQKSKKRTCEKKEVEL